MVCVESRKSDGLHKFKCEAGVFAATAHFHIFLITLNSVKLGLAEARPCLTWETDDSYWQKSPTTTSSRAKVDDYRRCILGSTVDRVPSEE